MKPRPNAGFTMIELVGAIILFSLAASGVLYMTKAMDDHRAAAMTTTAQNAYATFESQVALQGINPTLVGNPMAGAINQGAAVTGGAPTLGQNLNTAFEQNAVSEPVGAERALAGSVQVDAINYNVASVGNEATRGAGIGFAVETTGPAAPAPPNSIQLAPPVFNISGDLTNATFPLNNIATLPATNPTRTVYRYTTDGSTPTGSSPVWDNNPGWMPDGSNSFPAEVTVAAFNPDPLYATSAGVTASYSMQLSVTYARADGRTSELYGFSIGDLADPADTGIILSDNIDSYTVVYTLDGSNPTTSPTALAYGGPFAPPQGDFGPNVTLEAVAVSNDPRITPSAVMSYTLVTDTTPLAPPTFVTSNAQPLAPGSNVVISVSGGSASPRTEVNNGAPSQASSSSTSFPLN